MKEIKGWALINPDGEIKEVSIIEDQFLFIRNLIGIQSTEFIWKSWQKEGYKIVPIKISTL